MALQAVGGAAGNMIRMHNVVAACSVVGLLDREEPVVRPTLAPFLSYAILSGRVCYAPVSAPTPGVLNLGSLLVVAMFVAAELAGVYRNSRQLVRLVTHIG